MGMSREEKNTMVYEPVDRTARATFLLWQTRQWDPVFKQRTWPQTEARRQHEQGQIPAMEVMECPPSQWNRKVGVKTGKKVLEAEKGGKNSRRSSTSAED